MTARSILTEPLPKRSEMKKKGFHSTETLFIPDAAPLPLPKLAAVSRPYAAFYAALIENARTDMEIAPTYGASGGFRYRYRIYMEARGWIEGKLEAAISFSTACLALGLEVEWIRNRLLTRGENLPPPKPPRGGANGKEEIEDGNG